MRLHLFALVPGLFWSVGSKAQTSVGGMVAWSRSEIYDRGAPILGLLAESAEPWIASRFSLQYHLPSEHSIHFFDSGNYLTSGGTAAGHDRYVENSDKVSMLDMAFDRFWTLSEWAGRYTLRTGPGVCHSVEWYSFYNTIRDLTSDEVYTQEGGHTRQRTGLRGSLGFTWSVGPGALFADVGMEFYTFDWSGENAQSGWFERAGIGFGIIQPIGRQSPDH